jgi:hypothetical protein
MNVDVVSATSVTLGASERVLVHRNRLANLVLFDLQDVDKLVDYARAAWYTTVTNPPMPAAAVRVGEQDTPKHNGSAPLPGGHVRRLRPAT